jgi:dienelactone hydrolase
MNETWTFLSSYLDSHGPFDGIIGFSQGAALAAMLVSLLERDSRPATFKTTHPPVKFGVCYCGFRAPEKYEEIFYSPKIRTPILHVLGTLDSVVVEERSLALVKACVDERVVYHPGGHYLPAGRQFANVLLGYILENVKPKKEDAEENVEDMDVPF